MTQVAQPTLTWELWLTPFPKAVGEARRQVSSTLTDWQVPEDAVDTAVLITSELVTNAIRHCDNQHLVHLQVTDDGAELLLEVSDPSRNPPRPTVPPRVAGDCSWSVRPPRTSGPGTVTRSARPCGRPFPGRPPHERRSGGAPPVAPPDRFWPGPVDVECEPCRGCRA
ncbi:ATP-binding protein [Streptomyces sp. NPDC005065]|uniref:ATP-binding protein n=1 Tax=Streptomyces sp. NPDC005065 TaxID=3154461 RepID=UPI0033A537AF